MATKKTKGQTRLAKADEIIQQQIEVIDEQLEIVEGFLKPYEAIKERANRLRSARRALLGGSRLTGGGGSGVRQEDVVADLREHPGSRAGEIAERLHVPQTTISSHLNRGRNERFLRKDNKWYLRSPKDGVSTEADIPSIDDYTEGDEPNG